MQLVQVRWLLLDTPVLWRSGGLQDQIILAFDDGEHGLILKNFLVERAIQVGIAGMERHDLPIAPNLLPDVPKDLLAIGGIDASLDVAGSYLPPMEDRIGNGRWGFHPRRLSQG